MFTKFSTVLMIAAASLATGLGTTAHAQCMPPIIPQVPTFPQPPVLLPVFPIQPILTPTLPVCPAPLPRPAIAQPAARPVAFTGDDDGCIPSHGNKLPRPTPSPRPSEMLDLA